MKIRRVALLGFGEVGAILGEDLANAGDIEISAYDIKFSDPASRPSGTLENQPRIRSGGSAPSAVAMAQVVVSAVTAAEALGAARASAPGLQSAAWFFDLNSVAPDTRREAARVIEAAGGRYVEGAVMSPVPPRRIASPILLGGPHAAEFAPVAQALGFKGAEFFSAAMGQASATKMCRSVIVKGMEALLCESLVAARHYGVTVEVLTSLDDLFPDPDWPGRARYMISRSLEHGQRRAEEMDEVARTVREAGLDPLMSEATAGRQRWAAQFSGARHEDLIAMLDEIRARLPGKRGESTC